MPVGMERSSNQEQVIAWYLKKKFKECPSTFNKPNL
jgi:hypothetical protein